MQKIVQFLLVLVSLGLGRDIKIANKHFRPKNIRLPTRGNVRLHSEEHDFAQLHSSLPSKTEVAESALQQCKFPQFPSTFAILRY